MVIEKSPCNSSQKAIVSKGKVQENNPESYTFRLHTDDRCMNKKVSKEELQNLIYTDELTRINNLRYLREQIPEYLDKANKQGDSVAFLLFDKISSHSIS